MAIHLKVGQSKLARSIPAYTIQAFRIFIIYRWELLLTRIYSYLKEIVKVGADTVFIMTGVTIICAVAETSTNWLINIDEVWYLKFIKLKFNTDRKYN